MCYVQSCPPMEAIFGGFCEAISEMFCDTFFLLDLDRWFMLERLKREPTKCWLTRNTIYPLLIYYLFLWERPLVSSLLFPSLNSSSTSKTKGKRYHHFNHYDSQGVAEDILKGWLRTNNWLAIEKEEVNYPFLLHLIINTLTISYSTFIELRLGALTYSLYKQYFQPR